MQYQNKPPEPDFKLLYHEVLNADLKKKTPKFSYIALVLINFVGVTVFCTGKENSKFNVYFNFCQSSEISISCIFPLFNYISSLAEAKNKNQCIYIHLEI